MIHTILVILQVFVCLGLIGLVLVQHGKGADMGASFGSGASATVFGSRGAASFLTRITAGFATAFFILSLLLAYFSVERHAVKSVVNSVTQEQTPVKTGSDLPPTETKAQDTLAVPQTTIPVTK